jgi:hypothetical protein
MSGPATKADNPTPGIARALSFEPDLLWSYQVRFGRINPEAQPDRVSCNAGSSSDGGWGEASFTSRSR